ncbi:Transcription factor GTE4 [Platanthera guangdongensis]|uniref:Transcription factor GTE4 n=1 Tax=Platanthera guangdongensis TaxID=2320717 RepID=A0ABR2LYL8_9ASPA
MASGQLLGGGALGNGSRDKRRLPENKVYAPKSHTKSAGRNGADPTFLATAADLSSSYKYLSPINQRSLPAPRFAPPAGSDDGSRLSRPHQNLPLNWQHDSVTISLSYRSREEVRNLRQKLSAELNLVRDMARKLETRLLQAASSAPVVSYTTSQLSVSDPSTQLPAKRTSTSSGCGASSLNDGRTPPKPNHCHTNSDFLRRKQCLRPPESHGQKNHEDLDRAASADYFRNCRDLLAKMMKHKHGWVFNSPVDVKKLNIPDYHRIIKHPMDLGTVRNRLDKNFYRTPNEFAEDVRLTFINAMTYNPKGQDVHNMAKKLLNTFEESWTVIEAEYSCSSYPSSRMKMRNLDLRTLERSDSTIHPSPIETKTLVANTVRPTGKSSSTKKPMAKDPNKRDMTFEEKQRLSFNLQNLPPEKLENVVQIIKKRNSSLSQHDDEIEVDIDCMDVETLWELDRFVTNYKKNLSKNKLKEKLAGLATTGITSDDNGKVAGVVTAGDYREAKIVMDEKEVSLSSTIREETKGENSSRSTSSSSSGSDTGSSSRDSDSESSSEDGL